MDVEVQLETYPDESTPKFQIHSKQLGKSVSRGIREFLDEHKGDYILFDMCEMFKNAVGGDLPTPKLDYNDSLEQD